MRKYFYMVIIIIITLFWSCSTVDQSFLEDKSSQNSADVVLSASDAEECRMYRSYQSDYWKDKNYRRCIYCNMYMMEYDCDFSNDKVNYYNLARSFIELDSNDCTSDCGCVDTGSCADSAFWALNQGLEGNNDDEILLELGAYMSVKTDNITQAIYYLDKAISFNEENLRVLEQLSDLYAKEERYEDQIEVLDMWIKLDLDEIKYKKAIGEKKQAYEALGRESSDVDKERWVTDKSNMLAGIYFLQALKEIDEHQQIVDYADEMLFYEPENIIILEFLAESYVTIYEYSLARDVYDKLFGINQDYKYAVEISKIFIEEEQYQKAYTWSEKAVSATINNEPRGEAVFQRAEVLFYLAKSCQDSELSFWDKIVYELALEDYEIAYQFGQYNARIRKNSLAKDDYYITTPTDWFLNASGVDSASPSRYSEKITVSLKDCYSWLNREIKSK